MRHKHNWQFAGSRTRVSYCGGGVSTIRYDNLCGAEMAFVCDCGKVKWVVKDDKD